MPSGSRDFKQQWKDLLKARGGSVIINTNDSQLFTFAQQNETAQLIRYWEDALGTKDLFLIGYLPSGDLICAHPDGELFVVLHDTFSWWDSDVSLEEFLERLDSGDETLEEEIYSRPHRNPKKQRRHAGMGG